MVAKLKVRVVGGARGFGKGIIDGLLKDLTQAIKRAESSIVRRVRTIIFNRLVNSPEVVALRDFGGLGGEIGVPNIEQRMQRIIQIWVKSTKVKFTPFRKVGTRVTGGFTITAVNSSFKDVLSAPDAKFVTEHADILPWLEWLLLEGNRGIVQGYTIGIAPRRSRTGNFVMSQVEGDAWHVPPEFSGTLNNNFVTRALDGVNEQIEKILAEEINKRL